MCGLHLNTAINQHTQVSKGETGEKKKQKRIALMMLNPPNKKDCFQIHSPLPTPKRLFRAKLLSALDLNGIQTNAQYFFQNAK